MRLIATDKHDSPSIRKDGKIYVSRRELIAGAGAAAFCGCACAASESVPRGLFREKERDIPLDDWADVIVAGGGPAGIAAAVSAARAGKKVRLFELQG